MATRLMTPDPDVPRPITLDSAFARAYGELRGACEDYCRAQLNDHELLRARVEQTAVRLEKALSDLIYDQSTVRWLARPRT